MTLILFIFFQRQFFWLKTSNQSVISCRSEKKSANELLHFILVIFLRLKIETKMDFYSIQRRSQMRWVKFMFVATTIRKSARHCRAIVYKSKKGKRYVFSQANHYRHLYGIYFMNLFANRFILFFYSIRFCRYQTYKFFLDQLIAIYLSLVCLFACRK